MPSLKPRPGRCGSLISHWKRKFGVKQYCEAYPIKGRTRCRCHGGRSLRGVEHPRFKKGLHVKNVFPDQFYGKTFDEVFNDAKLKQTLQDIATLEVRIVELRQSLESGVGSGLVKKLHESYHALVSAVESGGEVKQTLRQHGAYLDSLQHNASTWEELGKWIERKDRLISAEHKRFMDTHQTVSLEQLLLLARQFVTILHEEIPDRTVATRINERIRGLLPQLKRESSVHRNPPF